MNVSQIGRFALVLLTGFGVFAGANLSWQQITIGDICPMLGPVPACFVVLAGYALMLVSVFVVVRMRKLLFFAGWVPVMGLASIGVVLELLQGDICPPGPAAIPQCFISLAMVVLCLLLFLKFVQTGQTRDKNDTQG
ncbi:hypothetical protein MNBD_ALPHA06-1805 [hydrothermal vent metagenome]|uniref:Vitamin K epoxide reductase domain-containing protein n=1 Tax=hydrothermal vent metagenome TaxID=652676 RepID=A0A3B0R252_9ZZZZ